MLARWSIPRLFTLLGAIGVMLTLGAMALSARGAYVEALEGKKTALRELVDAGVAIAQSYVERAQAGTMTVTDAQRAALGALGAARFDHGNYLFVYSADGTVLETAKKAQIGTNQYGRTDSHGTRFIAIMITTALSGHSIYLHYALPRANTTIPEPKLSYSEAIPSWGWMIGTGVYVADLNAYVMTRLVQFAEIFLPLCCAFMLLIFFVQRSVSRLLTRITASMDQIGEGALDAAVPGMDRQDEIGRMARRVTQFRDAAIEKRALEQHAQAERGTIEAERRHRETEREAADRGQAFVVQSVATGLAKLAGGELLFRLGTPFGAVYETLRSDFNTAMAKLGQVMTSISGNARAVRS